MARRDRAGRAARSDAAGSRVPRRGRRLDTYQARRRGTGRWSVVRRRRSCDPSGAGDGRAAPRYRQACDDAARRREANLARPLREGRQPRARRAVAARPPIRGTRARLCIDPTPPGSVLRNHEAACRGRRARAADVADHPQRLADRGRRCRRSRPAMCGPRGSDADRRALRVVGRARASSASSKARSASRAITLVACGRSRRPARGSPTYLPTTIRPARSS
jgi:hypothetical protein